MSDVLVIDDEIDIRNLISEILKEEGGYTVSVAGSAATALEQLTKIKPKVIILDIWLEGSHMDGIGVLKSIKQNIPHVPVIMISGHGNIETATQTMKIGAYDFIEKPFKTSKLLILVKRAIEIYQLMRENAALKQQSKELNFIGTSKAISRIRNSIKAAAPTNSRVFITGESGSGKSTAAQMIHTLSNRREKNFVSWNISNKNSSKLTEELLGHKDQFWPCLLEQCDGGTLFIDEIADLPMDLQATILQILQSGSFSKLESKAKISCDVRIIAASSEDPSRMIKDSRMNEGLYYRINIVRLDIPSLKHRKQDIEPLSEHFMEISRNEIGKGSCKISAEAYDTMNKYNWPGNVRQLKNAIEWMMIISSDKNMEQITKDMLPSDVLGEFAKQSNLFYNPVSEGTMSKPIKEAREDFEKEYIRMQLSKFNNNIAKTASFIGMDRAALHRKIKNLGI